MPSTFYFRVLTTLLLALAGGSLCVLLGTPLPWVIGPLLTTAVASILNVRTESSTPLRNAGQGVIAAALGLYFTTQVMALVISLWWAIVLSIIWMLLLGWLFGLWLQYAHGKRMALHPATTWFAGAIGGASEMTLLCERERGQTELVAAAHSMRLLIVTILIPFGMQFSGLHGLDLLVSGTREVNVQGLLVLAVVGAASAWAMGKLGRANPWFMGPLLVTIAMTLAGLELSAVPKYLSNAAQLVIGVSLGVRFTPAFVHTAPRWLAAVAWGSVWLIVLSSAFAWVLAGMTGLHPATLILAGAPGGIAEMAITAKVLQLGAPVVTAFQVCRLITILSVAGPLYRRFGKA